MPTLATSLLQGLKDHGAREIFGIPGDFVLPFFKVIEESGILPHYTLSHEPGVGFAADAAARYHCDLGVAVITFGAGAFNLVNPIAGAYAERSPVVVIAGAPGAGERSSGFVVHHQARTIDTQLAVYREITCDQAVLTDAETAPAEIARVLRSARERSLPVYLELPRDMTAAPAAAVPVLPRRSADPDALAECAEEIIARLAQASAPVILVDVEIRRYDLEHQVTALARKFGVPVVTTFMGRGLLESAPDVLVGTYLGAAGDPAITRLVEEADALLLLGVILSDTNFALSQRRLDPRRTMLAFDRAVRVGHHVYPDVPIDDLIDALAARARPLGVGDARLARQAVDYPRGLKADDAPVDPSDIAAAVNDLFDRHGAMPMTADVGDCLFTAMEIENTALAAPGYYAGMGFGVPGRHRRRGRDRPPSADPRRRRRLPDDRLGARQLPALRPRPDRGAVQQRQLGNAARVPAGVALQRPRRLALRGDGAFARRAWRARADAGRAQGRARARGGAARPILAGGGHAAAQRDVADARAVRVWFQGDKGDAAMMALKFVDSVHVSPFAGEWPCRLRRC